MSSSVFFKFKSQKEPSRVTFDGTGISVFELKREIISINRLGDGTDFDLAIYNEDTNEEYDDDTTIIPRSTSIIARRLPAAKAGRGSAARYVSGKMPVHARNAGRVEAQATKPTSQAPAASSAAAEMDNAQTEEERIAAMFKAGADQWEQQQQEMANATPVYRGGPFKGKPMNVPDHKPPQGYICYRCGEKGHWIQACPTNNDPNFDGRPRVKRTTGIPRSFLKTIEKPAALGGDGLTEDARQVSGVMVNAEGEFVIAEPDKASWEQYQAKAKVSAAAQEAAATGSKEVRERGLECPIDKRMFVEPTKSPCCGRTYCAECISNALIESDFVCPGCSSEGVLIDNLEPDAEAAQKIKEF
ncbi:DWNN-domain-containing protein, partial [Xylona heveae TC161]